MGCAASVWNTHGFSPIEVFVPTYPPLSYQGLGCRAAVSVKNGPKHPSDKRHPTIQVKCPEHGGVVRFASKDVLHVFSGQRVFRILARLAAVLVAKAHRTSSFLL